MQADQYINVTLLVDNLKVATRVCEEEQIIPDSADLAPALVEAVKDDQAERQ